MQTLFEGIGGTGEDCSILVVFAGGMAGRDLDVGPGRGGGGGDATRDARICMHTSCG
jgi:hypothetical protein